MDLSRDDIPAEGLTVKEAAEAWGVTQSPARNRMNKYVDRGLARWGTKTVRVPRVLGLAGANGRNWREMEAKAVYPAPADD